MAVFKQELNWSSFQEKQMDVLRDIGRSLEVGLQTAKSLTTNMNSVERALTSIASASKVNAQNLYAITEKYTGSAEKFVEETHRATRSAKELSDNLGRTGSAAKKAAEEIESAGTSFSSILGRLGNEVLNGLGGLRGIGDSINMMSEASNQMLKLSGATGAQVREFRGEIMSIVSDLNSKTGYAYNPQKAYDQIISMSQGVTSNLAAIEEMSAPLLLTYESLDVNINSVAELFNRFYTRYNFSSMHMEETLDSIRGNTASNSASAENVMKAYEDLAVWVNNYAGADNDKRQIALEELSATVSRLDAMDINPDMWQKAFEVAAGGDWASNPEIQRIFSYGGLSTTQATDAAQNAQFTKMADAYLEGTAAIVGLFDKNKDGKILNGESYALKPSLDNFGLDFDEALNIYSLMNSGRYMTAEDFAKSVKDNPTMEDIVEDKYISAADKANNWLGKIYEGIASIQEYLPFGFSDVVIALAAVKGIFGGSGVGGEGVKKIFSKIIGSQGSMKHYNAGQFLPGGGRAGVGGQDILVQGSQKGLLGGLNKLGAAKSAAAAGTTGATVAGVGLLAGVAAGGALAVDGISGILSEDADATSKGLSAIEAGAGIGGAAALIGLGVSNPIGWVALAVGGIALFAKKAHEATSKIGAADAVEKAYEEAAQSVKDAAKDQELSLLEIKGNLRNIEITTEYSKDLESARQELINSGLLSAEDLKFVQEMSNDATESNIEALKNLTEVYLKATDQWSTESEKMIFDYQKKDMEYAKGVHGNLEEVLQNWNDSGALTEGSEQLAATENLMLSLYQSLDSRKRGGEEFEGPTKAIYEKMANAFTDATLTQSEANDIIDSGFFNTDFQNANFSVEELLKAGNIFASTNEAGRKSWDTRVVAGLGTYYGVDNVKYVADAVAKLNAGFANHTMSESEATAILDDLKAKGYTSSMYEEIGDAASTWGLSGYAEGSNYISRDQLAVVHEGEAIIPKKFNPSILNASYMRESAEILAETQSKLAEDSKISNEYLAVFVEEMREIKEFIKEWKLSNERSSKISEIRNRYGYNSDSIRSYDVRTY